MDWEKLIPPPVPDDQNFFKANPSVVLQFVRIPTGEDPRKVGPTIPVPVIDLSPSTNSFPVLDTVRTEATKLIRNTLGEWVAGVQGFDFSAVQLDKLVPLQIMVQATTSLSVQDLESLLSVETETNMGRLRIEAADGNNGSFHLLLTGVKITSATDYLKWIDQFAPFFNEIREALKRPYAQIEGDYSLPYKMPVPGFIMMRSLTQTLAQRAQCYLLLGQPEEALWQLTLLHDSCRILQNAPTGRPLTLVASMINTAISGLYGTAQVH